ncbi:dTTP/UTP pyrophosphatase [Penicillium verhagenii]|nr:dTTP/UTP pyrophosphatase [Penicillium verhagenii]
MNVNKWKFIIDYRPRKSAANQRMITVGKPLVHDKHRDPQSSKTQLQQPSTPPNPQATTMSNPKADLLDFEDSNDSPPAYDPSIKPAPAPSRGALPRPPPLSLPALNALRSKRVILASQSPRRRQIISFLGLPNLEIIPSNADEDLPQIPRSTTKKAQAVYTQEIDNEVKGEPALILAADTIVVDVTTDAILEKPRSEAHHFTMLRALRDARDHKVYTALVAMAPLASARQPGYAVETVVEETNVRFDGDVTDDLLMAYVRTREGADKAGGYGLQGLGSILIEKIEGSYDNVIGLPLKATLKLIETVMQKANDEDRLEGDPLLEEDEDEDE